MCFLEMSENLQRHVSNGAAQMSGVLLHTVDQLIRDKRGAKAVGGGGGGGVCVSSHSGSADQRQERGQGGRWRGRRGSVCEFTQWIS